MFDLSLALPLVGSCLTLGLWIARMLFSVIITPRRLCATLQQTLESFPRSLSFFGSLDFTRL